MIPAILTHHMRSVTQRIFGDYRSDGLGEDSSAVPLLPQLPNETDRAPSLLYIHIPFCASLCPYCSFHRVKLEVSLAEAYFDSLQRELASYKRAGFTFREVYIGGGTPTVLPARLLETIETLHRLWPIKSLSVETNPDHLVGPHVDTLIRGGVSRLSVGVQTFQDHLLVEMNRLGSYGSGSEIQSRLSELKGKFDTLNIDMMFNLPTQTADDLCMDIEALRALQVDQITYYPLMGSRAKRSEMKSSLGSSGHRNERGYYRRIVESLSDTYDRASAWCFSNGAGLTDEYIVDHHDFACAGSGAFGYLHGSLYINTFSIRDYIETAAQGRLPVVFRKRFSPRWQARYELLMQLFTGRGSIDALSARLGGRVRRYLALELALLAATRAAVFQAGTIQLTERGYYYLLVLMREFFNGVNELRSRARVSERLRLEPTATGSHDSPGASP